MLMMKMKKNLLLVVVAAALLLIPAAATATAASPTAAAAASTSTCAYEEPNCVVKTLGKGLNALVRGFELINPFLQAPIAAETNASVAVDVVEDPIATTTPYDILIPMKYGIDELVSEDGMKVHFLDSDSYARYNKPHQCLEVMLFSLKFNSGKTSFLEHLVNLLFGSGHDIETQGISGFEKDGICYKEIMGFGKSDRNSTDRHQSAARDFILTQVAQKIPHVLIIVVNELTITDLAYLSKFQRDALLSNPELRFIYVHNPYTYGNHAAMDILIQNDILQGFGGIAHYDADTDVKWWTGRAKNEWHYVYGNNTLGNPLGATYNSKTLAMVRNQLQSFKGTTSSLSFMESLTGVTANGALTITTHPNLNGTNMEIFLPVVNPMTLGVKVQDQKPQQSSGWYWPSNILKPIGRYWAAKTQDRDSCKAFKNLSLDVYDIVQGEFVNNSVSLKLANIKSLRYFKADDLRGGSIPDMTFNIRYHVFIASEKTLIMEFEVLDADYELTYEKNKVILSGCRNPPSFEVTSILTSGENRPTYSTFLLTVEIPDNPEVYPYDFYAANALNTLTMTKTNGMLRLEFPKL